MIFKIISVGRSHWENGYVYALDACKILKEAGFQFHYLIIDSLNDIELRYQIHDLALKKHVTLMGEKSFETVKSKIHSADLLLQSSIKNGDLRYVLEAMALETIVLSTDCGEVDEVIINGINGFVIPIRNPKSIAESIMKIQSLSEEKKSDIKREAINTLQSQHKNSN